jgi:hypothetical protein
MRTVIHAMTSLLTLTTCLPGLADTAIGQQSPPDAAFVADAIESDALELYRAGTEVNNSIRPAGLVESNKAYNVASGLNSISEGAFANASGLPIVIQNSGTNVLIQNATIVNIQLE